MRCIALCMGLLLLPACSGSRQQYAQAAAEVQGSVEQLQQAVGKATGAKVRVMMAGSSAEREFRIPQEEFASLCAILSHTSAAPPALETDESKEPELPYFIELVFADAHGVDLTGVALNREPWMPASAARKLSPARLRSSLVPEWCLPDADFIALQALPTIPQAKAWANAWR